MIGVKRAYEIQRGWSERAVQKSSCRTLFIESLNLRDHEASAARFGHVRFDPAAQEACPYSDVDCFGGWVGKNEDVDVIKRAAMDVQNQLEVVGTAWEGTDSSGARHVLHDGFHFCHGGLSPEKMCATPEGMIDFIQGEAGANAHVLDALGGTFFYGKWRVLRGVHRESQGSFVSNRMRLRPSKRPLDSLKKYLADENKDKKYREKENLIFTIIKDRLYRPAQQVVKGVAQFYGITEVETRVQVQKLKAQGKLSTAVFNFLEGYLNDVAKLRIANHTRWGREYEIIYFKNPEKPTKEEAELIQKGKFPLVTGVEKQHVNKLMADSEAIRDLGNEFVRQKSKTGYFVIKKNPFMTSNPHEFS